MAVFNPYNYKRPVGVQPVQMATNQMGNTSAATQQPKADAYLEQRVLNAKPEELTLMLYDGIVKFVNQAKLFNEQKNYEKSNNANMRAQAILEELRATLDLQYEIAENLEALYVFMRERLVDANVKKATEILDEVLELAVDLRDTWKQAMGL